MYKPTWNSNEISHGEQGGYPTCEECGVKFSNTEDDPMFGGNGEDYSGRNLYCGKCRASFKDKGELKGHVVESSEHSVCPECSQEFHIVEALGLHWNQVCFQPFFSSIVGALFL